MAASRVVLNDFSQSATLPPSLVRVLTYGNRSVTYITEQVKRSRKRNSD
jgi:hypothetical protein